MKATINVTDTMLKKSIIDANKSVCDLAREFSFDYSEHEAGDKNAVSCRYPDGIIAKVTFYAVKVYSPTTKPQTIYEAIVYSPTTKL